MATSSPPHTPASPRENPSATAPRTVRPTVLGSAARAAASHQRPNVAALGGTREIVERSDTPR